MSLPVRCSGVQMGDENQEYVTVDVGDTKIHIYESLIEPGRVVIDVDCQPEHVAVAINDDYVHGGPPVRPEHPHDHGDYSDVN